MKRENHGLVAWRPDSRDADLKKELEIVNLRAERDASREMQC